MRRRIKVEMYVYIPENQQGVDRLNELKASLDASKYEISHYKQVGRMEKKRKGKWA